MTYADSMPIGQILENQALRHFLNAPAQWIVLWSYYRAVKGRDAAPIPGRTPASSATQVATRSRSRNPKN
jgi:hypothetical protein